MRIWHWVAFCCTLPIQTFCILQITFLVNLFIWYCKRSAVDDLKILRKGLVRRPWSLVKEILYYLVFAPLQKHLSLRTNSAPLTRSAWSLLIYLRNFWFPHVESTALHWIVWVSTPLSIGVVFPHLAWRMSLLYQLGLGH